MSSRRLAPDGRQRKHYLGSKGAIRCGVQCARAVLEEARNHIRAQYQKVSIHVITRESSHDADPLAKAARLQNENYVQGKHRVANIQVKWGQLPRLTTQQIAEMAIFITLPFDNMYHKLALCGTQVWQQEGPKTNVKEILAGIMTEHTAFAGIGDTWAMVALWMTNKLQEDSLETIATSLIRHQGKKRKTNKDIIHLLQKWATDENTDKTHRISRRGIGHRHDPTPQNT